ncbi:hypothetical protein EZV73_03345 [Acidaminobacter sp. JC074]|uniref:hypothetical protein n=1 Tax=Acidaminobacter sp. JC074 TaxID=2530199 RepID=UPI001F0CEC42|nr:hypothetical protein [Acidaminobacter sp. JC074]MCH4886585.1 hypothetical protein [Acidaminobacter sp. JC074]
MKKKLLSLTSLFLLLAIMVSAFNMQFDAYAGEDDLEGILVASEEVVLVAGDEDIPGVWAVPPIVTCDGDEDIPGVW